MEGSTEPVEERTAVRSELEGAASLVGKERLEIQTADGGEAWPMNDADALAIPKLKFET